MSALPGATTPGEQEVTYSEGGKGEDPIWQALARAREGDREAFAVLYDRYLDTVYRFIYRRVGNGNVALVEDLTSETFTRALRAIRSFKDRGCDPGFWFLAIARNLILDHVKSARNRLELPTGEFQEESHRAGDRPEEEVIGRLTVAEAMAALDDGQREVVVLRLLEDRSVAETALLMGRSEGAVKALQHRAVRRLAARFPGGMK